MVTVPDPLRRRPPQKLVLLADPALSAWVPMELQHTALPAPKSPLFDDRLCDLGPAWRHMTSLHVNEVHKVCCEGPRPLLRRLRFAMRAGLHLGQSCVQVHPDSMATFLSHLVNLRDLSLVDGDCFTDVVAGSVLRHCTQLARLCIVSLQPLRLTPAGLAQLGRMTTLTHLQLQDISECQVRAHFETDPWTAHPCHADSLRAFQTSRHLFRPCSPSTWLRRWVRFPNSGI